MKILFQTDDGQTIRTLDPLAEGYMEKVVQSGVNITQLLLDDCLVAMLETVEVECQQVRKKRAAVQMAWKMKYQLQTQRNGKEID